MNIISDIGAGDGEVTMRLAKSIVHIKNNIFLKVFATEYSWTMRDRLSAKQFMYNFERKKNLSSFDKR